MVLMSKKVSLLFSNYFCVLSQQVHLSFASRSLPPYIALKISMISRGGVKINTSCYTIKHDLKNGSCAPV